MEAIITALFVKRIEALQKLVCRSEELKDADILTLEDVTKARIGLKLGLENFNKDMDKYLQVSTPSEDTIQTGLDVKSKAEEMLIEMEVLNELHNSSKTTHENDTSAHLTKLPTLQLPRFDGNILNFNEFWDRFAASVEARNLKPVDKLTYLVGCLDGSALETIQGLATTNENYPIAVEMLTKRYGNKNILINAHYGALNKLRKASDDHNDCRIILNTISKHLRVLSSLGEATGNHLRVLIIEKFPERVVYELNVLKGIDCDVLNILDGLERIIIAMENAKPQEKPSYPVNDAHTTGALHAFQQRHTINQQSRKRKVYTSSTQPVAAKKPRLPCIFCQKEHHSGSCSEVKTLEERKRKLQGRCFKCFRPGHSIRECRIQRKCYYCNEGHNQALCPRQLGNDTPVPVKLPETLHCMTSNNLTCCLQTATVKITSERGTVACRLLLDSGSQRSYISAKMAKKLDLYLDSADYLMVYTFGSNTPREIVSPSADINIQTKRGVQRNIKVNVVPYITDHIPVPKFAFSTAVDIFADDDSLGESIDLLIGNDLYFSFIKNQIKRIQDHLYLINTDFGWIVSGSKIEDEDNYLSLSVITYCQCQCYPYFSEPDLPLKNIDMSYLWSLESIGIVDSPKATREEEAVKHFNETAIYSKGRYEVKWPWVAYPPELPTNFGLSIGRLRSLLKRADEPTLRDYEEILSEQLQSGVIELVEHQAVPSGQVSPPVHYLPHHIVKQSGKRGRLVYDASAKTGDQKSLNECMYRGPSLLEDLTGLLLKFRSNMIGISADIEKAFLQVGLQPEDRDVTRFLWVKDVKKELTEDNLLHYRFCRVPFGIIASPFLLTATIRHHMSKSTSELLRRVADRCYVDNLVTGAMSRPEAVRLYQDTRNSFEELSMNIRDWVSNDPQFLKSIPKDQQAKETEKAKVLGLIWTLKDDMLQLQNPDFSKAITSEKPCKKIVLSTLSRLYDPCGFASPLVLPAKLLFQELCTRKLKWNTPLPTDLLQSWAEALQSLENAKDIKLPRYIGSIMKNENSVEHELHCFTDASKNAYAAVVYIVSRGLNSAATTFLMSKSRITPAEDKTDLKIPRLELLGFLIGNRLLNYVARCMDLEISMKYLWTDSLIVLAWMKTTKLLPPFVSRRVNEIKQNGDVERRYVPTQLNPADVATRPDAIKQKERLWFSGPEFLSRNEENWPNQHTIDQKALCSATMALDVEVDGPEMTEKGFEESPTVEEETSEYSELLSAAQIEIRQLQKEHFPDEVEGKVTHLTRNLDLFTDVDGILRCGGRMANTGWSYDKTHPILLPKDCDFTVELILKVHKDSYHVGVSHTLSIIREKFWIPQGRAQVQKVLKRCLQCIKHGGGPYALPPTPALPEERVKLSSPFTFTGIDYLGPLYVETLNGKEKRWICLFTCLAVRALHLEVVNNLSAEQCLLGLRRFIAIRGKPNMMVSDNATQFKLTSEILADTLCVENGIRWKFIPQLAPWYGGFYERLVALVKNCLKRTLEKHLLQDGQLLTIIKEVEAVLNTRPLTSVGSEMEQVLTPANFLSLGDCLEISPIQEHDVRGTVTKVDLLQSWKRGQAILAEFKKMFSEQYLPSLRERHKQHPKQPRVTSERSPDVGDIVQIKDDSNKNRNNWRVGRITALIKGKDGQCRVARVLAGDHEFTRSISHLYPLEGELEDQGMSEIKDPVAEPSKHREEDICLPIEEVFPVTPLENSYNSGVKRTDPIIDEPKLLENVDETPVTVDGVTITEEDQAEVPQESQDELLQQDYIPNPRVRREAAVRAQQKIAEWTRHLLAVLH